jgi:hypothetical protein
LIITGLYSHKNGEEILQKEHPTILQEIRTVISAINAESCRLKEPQKNEVKRAARVSVTHFYSPIHLNALFDWYLHELGWLIKPRIKTKDKTRAGFREMDALKERVGLEIQMGKYSFLTYDIVAKMVIFKNLGLIEYGIEICPMASMLPHMSSGIGAYEQVIWDLKCRGIADIDIPVVVLGVESEEIYQQRQGANKFRQVPRFEGDETKPEIEINRTIDLEKVRQKVRETGLEV